MALARKAFVYCPPGQGSFTRPVGFGASDRLLRVNGTHYRTAALLSASPQLAESIRAAKRFPVVPAADILARRSMGRHQYRTSPPSTIDSMDCHCASAISLGVASSLTLEIYLAELRCINGRNI